MIESEAPARYHVFSTDTLAARLDPISYYTLLFIDLNGRLHSDHFAEDFEVHLIYDGCNSTYIELYSLITHERLEWILSNEYKYSLSTFG